MRSPAQRGTDVSKRPPPPDREFVRSRVEPGSGVDTEAAVETTKADVMVLPGESLAKYRLGIPCKVWSSTEPQSGVSGK